MPPEILMEQSEWASNKADELHCLPNDGVGILADDPFFDEFVAEMKAYREQLDSTQVPE